MRTFDLEINAILEPEIDVGWISRVTVSLFHRCRLIGEKTLNDTYIFRGEENGVNIRLESFEIRNMTAFKRFFQKLMPEKNHAEKKAATKAVIATLENDENGHELSIGIDLNDVSKISIEGLAFNRSNDKIRLAFIAFRSGTVDIDFGCCQFILKKDKQVLAYLDGRFALKPDGYSVVMEGIVASDVDKALFGGMGTLTGFLTYDHNNTFLAHAIRLFEIQVKLS
ncbi:hypothetical protein BBK36DRAFT_1167916 [Trichoderma citrinoviride]|uniref:Uncharacterized protein n=1 Tax=Trichoderma citrinoviride TaxID=58853 RepID=A0A2T4BDV7_9HYPO|nr:hypothetical protein BBK36DRAFT_1167916 [Trichoderma citrinoviride]PTB67520.1 hypothetical protein BBK36DRAFT_1167916 [Trichoderma citrinoviride]